MKKTLFSIFLLFILLFTACSGDTVDTPPFIPNSAPPDIIISPYRNVNWETDGHFKAGLHVHTRSSDGSNTLTEMVEQHYLKTATLSRSQNGHTYNVGTAEMFYDILSINDHNYGPDPNIRPLQSFPITNDWTSPRHLTRDAPMTQTRVDQILAGDGRDGRGMLYIPYTSELAIYQDEINTYFFPHNIGAPRNGLAQLRSTLREVQAGGGLAQLNHPGRTTGGSSLSQAGIDASNDPRWVNIYGGLFNDFPGLVGMEIINRLDGDSASDRILWDNILQFVLPRSGRNVWGFSNDDAHSVSAVGFSFNVFVMPANNLANVKSTMVNGNFYAVARVSRRELGDSFAGTGATPAITKIEITNNKDKEEATIILAAANATKIVWISNGVEFLTVTENIADGVSLKISDYPNEIGLYVRANIIGTGGIAFTQPFIVRR